MGFGKSNEIKKLPNEKDILDNVKDSEIFDYYLGGLPSKPINSPLRDDVKPSFSLFFSNDHGKILFKDFSTGDTGDAFVFVMRLFKLSRRTEAFNRIASDFNLNQFETNHSVSTIPTRRKIDSTKLNRLKANRLQIRVRVRTWSKIDKEYWFDKYGLSIKELEYCKIYPISHYFINGYCKVAEKNAYAFIEEKDGIQTFKIYQPYSVVNKWLNNNDYSTWELWTQLPNKGNVLIISSSRKDAAVIKKIFKSDDITSCSLQSEGVNPKPIVIKELKERFKNVFVLYDNDSEKHGNPGRTAGKKICDKFDLIQIEVPSFFKLKDPSDFREIQGETNTRNMLLKIMRDSINKK